MLLQPPVSVSLLPHLFLLVHAALDHVSEEKAISNKKKVDVQSQLEDSSGPCAARSTRSSDVDSVFSSCNSFSDIP